MLPKEILKKVKKIHLKVARLSTDVLSGQYVSAFKGMGIEFNEVREYMPGDDIRSIDWNVTARSGVPHVKNYVEERELTMILMVDLSGSQRFGSAAVLKSELAAEISALFAFLAIKNNDKVGLLIFSNICEKYIPPKKGRGHVLRVIREILGYVPRSKGTDIAQALNFIYKVTNRRSIVFLVSDFLDTNYEKALRRVAKRHDLVAVRISDPREFEIPSIGLVTFEDNETGSAILVDTCSKSVRETAKVKAMKQHVTNTGIFSANKIEVIEISTNKSYLEPVEKFFLKRARKAR